MIHCKACTTGTMYCFLLSRVHQVLRVPLVILALAVWRYDFCLTVSAFDWSAAFYCFHLFNLLHSAVLYFSYLCFLFQQGADGVRGLKGSKGEKVHTS